MKSLYLKLILILLPLQLISLNSYSECSTEDRRFAEINTKEALTRIRKNFHERNVEIDVNKTLSRLSQCDIPLSKFGLTAAVFDFWKKRGYEAEFKRLKKSAEHTAKFYPPLPQRSCFT